jgi:hypothetical protein
MMTNSEKLIARLGIPWGVSAGIAFNNGHFNLKQFIAIGFILSLLIIVFYVVGAWIKKCRCMNKKTIGDDPPRYPLVHKPPDR